MDQDGYQLDVLKLKVDQANEKLDQVLYRLASIDAAALVPLVEELQRLRRAIDRA